MSKRRAPRIDVHYDGLLITSDSHEVKVVVRDLSRNGFRIKLIDGEVLVREHVHLRVGRNTASKAEIKWALGSEAGGIFLDSASVRQR